MLKKDMEEMYKFSKMPISPASVNGKSYESGRSKVGSTGPSQNSLSDRKGKVSESIGEDSASGWVDKNVNDIEVTEGRK